MTNLTQDQLATLIAQVVGQVLAGQTATPKATSKPQFLPKGGKAAPSDLASKDQHLINAFHRKGFKDVQLMDRTDPTKPFNVKPFKAWLDQGRIVRKGQRGIKGLFHVTQTDLLPGKASAKPTISPEQKALFVRAKAALANKKAKSQPTA
jgi:hypothetical protein